MDNLNQFNSLTDQLSSAMDMQEMVTNAIFGAAVTTTRAFGKVTLKIDMNTNRVFVSVQLRWWAKFKKFEKIQVAWLAHCERRVKQHLPTGWKALVYYDRSGETQAK